MSSQTYSPQRLKTKVILCFWANLHNDVVNFVKKHLFISPRQLHGCFRAVREEVSLNINHLERKILLKNNKKEFHLGSFQHASVLPLPKVFHRELVRRSKICRQSSLGAFHECDTVAGWKIILGGVSVNCVFQDLSLSLTDLFGKCSENGVTVDKTFKDSPAVVLQAISDIDDI